MDVSHQLHCVVSGCCPTTILELWRLSPTSSRNISASGSTMTTIIQKSAMRRHRTGFCTPVSTVELPLIALHAGLILPSRSLPGLGPTSVDVPCRHVANDIPLGGRQQGAHAKVGVTRTCLCGLGGSDAKGGIASGQRHRNGSANKSKHSARQYVDTKRCAIKQYLELH